MFFSGSSTNNTDRHDITEALLKVALNNIKQINQNKKQNKNNIANIANIPTVKWLLPSSYYTADLLNTAP